MTVIVFGSINIDLVATAPRLPVAGETLMGRDFFKAPGGKGANQAVAVARLGITTYMIGRVGAHSFGAELITSLQTSGVRTENVSIEATASSGVAVIIVDDTGENQIIVIPGANGLVDKEDVERLSNLLPRAKALLLQFEVPMSSVVAAARAAHHAGVKVILDPAPVQLDVPEELYSLVDIITPNEVEARQLVGFPVEDKESAAKAAEILLARGVKCVIIKLGAKGVYCASDKECFFIPAFPVQAIDTTAAGDAFSGGLAAAIASDLSLHDSVTWGAAAGAIAATKPGAQPSLPDKYTFDIFLKERGIRSLD
ncbi:ribokinase [Calothrix sp. UHCC 0171]|uniref:ribokinase n=1 Tax=Calothrix sp. UHCC 0171 TaxID=3110245 RepID=UPI002B202E17|nr:ribokinase [Calothrix sp. UHCC 0171]MEA5569742.1 ribokinase [Calothrix sp. UHCC 0171]